MLEKKMLGEKHPSSSRRCCLTSGHKNSGYVEILFTSLLHLLFSFLNVYACVCLVRSHLENKHVHVSEGLLLELSSSHVDLRSFSTGR
jgi:hypothetical protein